MQLTLFPLIAAVTASAALTPCIMPHTSGGDDAPGITKAIAKCAANSEYIFSAGVTYNLATSLTFTNLQNVKFSFLGNISIPQNVTAVQAVVKNTKTYSGRWISIKGNDVTFAGNKDRSGGWFLAHGEKWWADKIQTNRPHWFGLSVNNLIIEDIKVLNPVAWVFSLGSSINVTMTNTLIDARSENGFPFNTDAIDCSASNVLIDGLTVYNGDDVINVSPPATNIHLRNVIAYGSHGVAVSCSSGTGSNYLFENIVMHNPLFGARFKGNLGTTCQISNVTWKNMVINDASYPIHFIENYVDQETGPKGTDASVAAFTDGFTWKNISGSTGNTLADGSCISEPCWSATTGESLDKGLYLLCKDANHCKNFKFSGINLKTSSGAPASEQCIGLNGVPGMGITCTNGTITAAQFYGS